MKNLMIKRFKTDSGNPYFLLFEMGNIHKPLFVFNEYSMAEFKYNVLDQSKDIKNYLGHNLTIGG